MKTPPFLLGAVLLFWGWQTGVWILALPMALILEGSRLVQWRWEFAAEDYRRLANLCSILLVTALVYLLLTNRSLYLIYELFKWLPCIVFPLLAAQAYATRDRIDIRALFFSPKSLKLDNNPSFTYNFTYFYFIICLLAASAANTRDISFYIGLLGLSAFALWFVRSKRFSAIVWLCGFVMAGSIGFVGHIGLHQLNLILEQRVIEWLANETGQNVDLLQKNTAIGDIGSLKLSNGIVFRVDARDRATIPLLLRQATYDKYKSSTWLASNSNFTTVLPDNSGTTWHLGDRPTKYSTITVASTLHQGKGVLALPDNTFQLDHLPVSQLEKSPYGTVKVTGELGAIAYQIQFAQGLSLDSPPTEIDLQIADAEKSAVNSILTSLDVTGKSPKAVLKQIDFFFQNNFQYSLDLVGKGAHATPLSAFLLKTRSGHCEYFATATTLLLRAAGIPARYVTGYSVHEFSRWENQYIVRGRHAHAWTLAYIDGHWQAFDTTPASWPSVEDGAAPLWGFLLDGWSLVGFKLSEWFGQIRGGSGFKDWWWLGILLLCLLVWRFSGQKRVQRLAKHRTIQGAIAQYPITGEDSELYLIEQAFNQLGFTRHASESWKDWIERLNQALPPSELIDDLQPIIELHYRYRFDPAGIQASERKRLQSLSQSWLDTYQKSHTASRL